MSKMGISTLQSYRGAQIFEAIGLSQRRHRPLLHRHGLAHRRHRPGRDRRARSRRRHERAFPDRASRLPRPGLRAASTSGAATASTTCSTRTTVLKLQHATRRTQYRRSSQRVHRGWSTTRASELAHAARPVRVHGRGRAPIPLDEVEPAEAIVKRFATGAMSLRLDQQGGARDAGHRHEPPRRPEQHRRGRRGPRALSSRDANGDSRSAARSSRWPRAASA